MKRKTMGHGLKMSPYGKDTGSQAIYETRKQKTGGLIYYRLSIDNWRRIRRQAKKAARQLAKKEIREVT